MIQRIEEYESHASKFEKITRLLNGVCGFVVENIKIRIDITSKSYEVVGNAKRVAGRLCAIKECLQSNLYDYEQQ
jgi:hypothetical protein